MGSFHTAYWEPSQSGFTRKDRLGGEYRWFYPTLLANNSLTLESEAFSAASAARASIASLSGLESRAVSTEGIARLLLRAEAVSSSHIEGLTIGTRRLLRAELYEEEPTNLRFDKSAVEVVGNIHAMETAIAEAAQESAVTVETFKRIHRSLCMGTRIESIGGIVRTEQNWVGGSSFNPLSAAYVPPAANRVGELLEDLAAFCNRTDVDPVVKAALAHYQFETIHPFPDGNGRTGRALIHTILRHDIPECAYVPPISLILATYRDDYTKRLMDLRTDEEAAEANARSEWVSFFAACCSRAVNDITKLAHEMDAIRESWVTRLGGVRANSALSQMIYEIQGSPVFTVSSMVNATGKTFPAVNGAVTALLDAGIIEETSRGKRNRVFEAPEVISYFNLLERRLASRAGDTRTSKPERHVPFRDSSLYSITHDRSQNVADELAQPYTIEEAKGVVRHKREQETIEHVPPTARHRGPRI